MTLGKQARTLSDAQVRAQFDEMLSALVEIERLHRERDRAREMVSLMLKSVHERGSLKVEIGDGPYTVLLNIRDALEVRLGADTEQLLGSFTP